MTRSEIADMIGKRSIEEAEFILNHNSTIRGTAQNFKRTHNNVHLDLTVHLKEVNYPLWLKVKDLLQQNRRNATIRAGEATKRKYLLQRALGGY